MPRADLPYCRERPHPILRPPVAVVPLLRVEPSQDHHGEETVHVALRDLVLGDPRWQFAGNGERSEGRLSRAALRGIFPEQPVLCAPRLGGPPVPSAHDRAQEHPPGPALPPVQLRLLHDEIHRRLPTLGGGPLLKEALDCVQRRLLLPAPFLVPHDEAFYVAALALNTSSTTVTAGSIADITYSLEGAPEGLYLQPATGELFGTFKATGDRNVTVWEHNVTMYAVDHLGARTPMETITFRAMRADVDVPTNGPGGRACVNGGTPVDGVKLDQNFTCDCSTAAQFARAPNCDIDLAAQAAAAQGAEPASSSSNSLVVGLVVAVAIVLLFATVMYVQRRRATALARRAIDFVQRSEELKESGNLPDGAETTEMPREIKRSCVKQTSILGTGQFGEVFKAVLQERGQPDFIVAVKLSTLTEGEGAEELVHEAMVMASVGRHENLVSLVGVVTTGPPLMLLLSYCEHGSLLSLVKKRGIRQGPLYGPGTKTDVAIAHDVAKGMRHLVDHGFVHRDLAARNVLVDSTIQCKVADFGLSRGTSEGADYYRSVRGVFPLRWTAPESMQTLKFDATTDVWSFGIMLTEVYCNGDTPYPDLSNDQVITKVIGGRRIAQPEHCPDSVYQTLLRCWSEMPSSRPTFAELVDIFEAECHAAEAAGSAVQLGPFHAADASTYPLTNLEADEEMVCNELKQHVEQGGAGAEYALASTASAPECDLAAADRTTGSIGYDNIASTGAQMRVPAELVGTSGYLTVDTLSAGLEAEQGRQFGGDMAVSFARRARKPAAPCAHHTRARAVAHTPWLACPICTWIGCRTAAHRLFTYARLACL